MANPNAKIFFFPPDSFSDFEKSVLTWYVSKVMAIIMTRAPRLLANHTYNWKLSRPSLNITNIACDPKELIVLNDRTMLLAVEGYQSQNSNIISSVFHFLFKGFLRSYLSNFRNQEEMDRIYDIYWGYHKKRIVTPPHNTLKSGYVVSLPFHGNQRDYHPVIVPSPKGNQPVLIELISKQSDCYELTKVLRAVTSAECLISRFNGLYSPLTESTLQNSVDFNEIVDPNKIFITMVSEYVVSNNRYIGNDPAMPDIYNVIDNLIGNDCLSNLGQKAYPL